MTFDVLGFTINVLDVILVLVAIGYGISGYRQGFLIGALGVVGLLGGGLGGVLLTPFVLNQFEPSMTISLVALGVVVICALVGQAIGSSIGAKLRSKVTWQPAHAVDASGGAVLSVVALLVVAWILGSAVASAQLGTLARVVRSSEILTAVDRVMPRVAEQGLRAFGRVVDPTLFPRYLEPFAAESIAPAQPPDAGVLRDPEIQRAGDSVVRVLGVALRCSRSLEGSGFVYARDRVMTNAHVVAGVQSPTVETRDGETYDAEVVLYNPDRDIAVLRVDGLDLERLALDPNGSAGDQGAVMGYPGNDPFWAGPARIRAEQRLRGPDIYGEKEVVREVFSLYAQVRPGNSGGPLVTPEGTVAGVVFAASVEDSNTGYALTVDEVTPDAQAGARATEPVSTGQCS
jgi:S1-C subfamily serine protease